MLLCDWSLDLAESRCSGLQHSQRLWTQSRREIRIVNVGRSGIAILHDDIGLIAD